MKRPHRQHVEGEVAALYDYINNLEILASVLQAAVKENHEWHQKYDDHGGYDGSALHRTNEAALDHDLPDPLVPWPDGALVKNTNWFGTHSIPLCTISVPPGGIWDVSKGRGNDRIIRCRDPQTTVITDTVELDEHFVIHQLPL